MQVHGVDGTYELFRHYFALPEHLDAEGIDVGAVRGVVGSVLGMLEGGATHVGVATDQVIESFRNDLWPGYKTGAGIDPVLLAQFPVLEQALEALGVAVWAMVEVEADDALGLGGGGGVRRRASRAGLDLYPRQGSRGNASSTRRSCSSTAVTTASTTKRASGPSSVSHRSRSPIISRWWVTPPTASRGCVGGERSRPRRCSRATSTSRRSPSTRTTGTSTCAAR